MIVRKFIGRTVGTLLSIDGSLFFRSRSSPAEAVFRMQRAD